MQIPRAHIRHREAIIRFWCAFICRNGQFVVADNDEYHHRHYRHLLHGFQYHLAAYSVHVVLLPNIRRHLEIMCIRQYMHTRMPIPYCCAPNWASSLDHRRVDQTQLPQSIQIELLKNRNSTQLVIRSRTPNISAILTAGNLRCTVAEQNHHISVIVTRVHEQAKRQ